MVQRRLGRRMAVALFGLALAVAPLDAAAASTKQTHHRVHHSSKKKTRSATGANPGSALCKDLKSSQAAGSKLGTSIASALEAGNYAAAKRDMLGTLDAADRTAGPALAELRSAPSKVRSAMKTLISFYNAFKSTIENSSSLQGLEASLVQLDKNSQLAIDGTTVSNYVVSQCGAIVPTTVGSMLP